MKILQSTLGQTATHLQRLQQSITSKDVILKDILHLQNDLKFMMRESLVEFEIKSFEWPLLNRSKANLYTKVQDEKVITLAYLCAFL
jgi:hypothetical protein